MNEITLIVAVAKNGVIGNSKLNKLPWKIPEELQHFKEQTYGKVVVMGRTTANQVGPLGGRRCLFMSRSKENPPRGYIHADQAMVLNMNTEVMICGGAEIYSLFMPFASRVIMSELDIEVNGDIFMPKINRHEWIELGVEKYDRFIVRTLRKRDKIN